MNLCIHMEGHGRGKVFIDGKEIVGITGLTLKTAAGETNEACLFFTPHSVTYDGVADVTSIGDDARTCAKVDQ